MLAADRPVYRADRLLELAADLSDAVVAHALPDDAPGRVGESTVRVAALKVAAEAALVWGSTCGRPAGPQEPAARWAWPAWPTP
jgi:hypothetical protein